MPRLLLLASALLAALHAAALPHPDPALATARDPVDVHDAPAPAAKGTAGTALSSAAESVFAAYIAARTKHAQRAAGERLGLAEASRPAQDPAAALREAAERRRSLARDPDRVWRSRPEHLYTGHTYRPSRTHANTTAAAAPAASVPEAAGQQAAAAPANEAVAAEPHVERLDAAPPRSKSGTPQTADFVPTGHARFAHTRPADSSRGTYLCIALALCILVAVFVMRRRVALATTRMRRLVVRRLRRKRDVVV